ncbi:MAG: DNA glycosylase AlkZ-like family protein [Ktedonobacteraceae bacterium]
MSAAELALVSRVKGLSAQAIRSAIFQDHTLLKTWAMRATLHVLATSDLPLYVACMSRRSAFASFATGRPISRITASVRHNTKPFSLLSRRW